MILALAFEEPGWQEIQANLESFDVIYACDLLEAELHSAFRREKVTPDNSFIRQLELVIPLRPLRPEFERVLDAGYMRGADCFHLATALSLSPRPNELTFVTLDKRQRDAAAVLGFST